jgi:Alw26I/Eco31I/Esp3I family type II restriction m6 adenine DNA methyltransferase
LLNLYTGLIGRCEALAHRPILQWIETEKKKHPQNPPMAYWLKKKIVTENLYGVDLMEEATEIAKLRLFLSLVASAEKRAELEPLPNIEFNLLAGNSLIGLLHVDSAKFDSRSMEVSPTSSKSSKTRLQQSRIKLQYEEALGFTTETTAVPTTKETQQAHVATKRASEYARLLDEKNKSIELYKKHGFATGEIEGLEQDERLLNLRNHIEDVRRRGYERLNEILLEEFQVLGIQYEQATWDSAKKKEGKPKKRPLKIADIQALQPFHWAYEFDEIIVNRGGFDAIITNPPWEVFQTDEKEFSTRYESTIKKNSIRIEDWTKQFAKYMENAEFREAWLEYASAFPHTAQWLKNSPQYENQVAVIDGRQVATKLNLYKSFTEQCVHLLKESGRCGIVIPSGIYTDRGATQLRKMLFEQNRVTGLFGFENRKVIFEGVHRSFKFVVLSFSKGGNTDSFPVAFMRLNVSDLAEFPKSDELRFSLELIRSMSPDALSLMEFDSEKEIETAQKMLKHPLLGSYLSDCWNTSFDQELNMTSASKIFRKKAEQGSMPLFEGKMIHQFTHQHSEPRYWITQKEGRKAVLGRVKDNGQEMSYQRYRLGFRDIARNTDSRTLIAAIIPKTFCGNTLPVVGIPENIQTQLYLLSCFNSFVIDWLVRQKVTTHCNFFYLYQLPIPRLTSTHPDFRPLVERAARLVGTTPEFDDLLAEVFGKKATHKTHGVTDPQDRLTLRAQIDALVARLYDLTQEEFQHILGTFPLVDESVKTQTLNTYRELVKLGKFA